MVAQGRCVACVVTTARRLHRDTHRTRRFDYSSRREEDSRSDDCTDDDADAIHQRDVPLQFDIARTHAARYGRPFFAGSISHFFSFCRQTLNVVDNIFTASSATGWLTRLQRNSYRRRDPPTIATAAPQSSVSVSTRLTQSEAALKRNAWESPLCSSNRWRGFARVVIVVLFRKLCIYLMFTYPL